MPVPQLNTIAGANYDILAYSDNTFALQLTFTDGTGNPIAKNTSTFLLTVRKSLVETTPPTSPDWTASTGDGSITVTGTGHNVVNVSKELTIPGGNYYYELQETDANGTIITPIYGKMFVTKSVTTP